MKKQPLMPLSLRSWLFDPHSFMQRLKRFGVPDARVEVLDQSWQFPDRETCHLLQVDPHRYVLVRDVLIHSKKINWMVARTVFPQETLRGSLRQLIYLKNRSLGSVLFKDPRLRRSQFEIDYLSKERVAQHKIMQLAQIASTDSWARQSIFYLQNKKILLTEYFFSESFSTL